MVFALQQKISFLGDKNFQFFPEIHGDDQIKKICVWLIIEYLKIAYSRLPQKSQMPNSK